MLYLFGSPWPSIQLHCACAMLTHATCRYPGTDRAAGPALPPRRSMEWRGHRTDSSAPCIGPSSRRCRTTCSDAAARRRLLALADRAPAPAAVRRPQLMQSQLHGHTCLVECVCVSD